MDRHRRLRDKAATVKEICKLDYIAYFGKFSKQVSWKSTLLRLTNSFFLSGFSFTDTDNSQDSTAGEGRDYLFATLHVRWLSHIFNHIACIDQTATRWYLPPYWITILIDDVDIKCLFTWWFDSSFFVIAIWVGKPVDLNLHRLLP